MIGAIRLDVGDMHVEGVRGASVVTFKLSGEMNSREPVEELQTLIDGYLERADVGSIGVNLTKLKSMNSTGIWSIVRIGRAAITKQKKVNILYDKSVVWQRIGRSMMQGQFVGDASVTVGYLEP